MVTAGIKKIKIHGANLKNGLISAKPEFKMLNSPSKTQRNNPLSKRKIPMTKYPIGEPKKDFISRNNNAFIFYFLFQVSSFKFFNSQLQLLISEF